MKYMSRSKSAAVKDIDIDTADILGQKYRYRIDIGKGDDRPTSSLKQGNPASSYSQFSRTVSAA